MNTPQELLDMVATEAVERYHRAEAVASSAVVRLWVCGCGWRDNYERLMTSQSGLKMICPSCGNWAEPCKPNEKLTDGGHKTL